MADVESAKRETIAIVGGGLSGCLTALLLTKQGYRVKLIESQPLLLNGASRMVARLHLGGEYAPDEKTARDCVNAAVAWKLQMPEGIYTNVKPMKFAIANATHKRGVEGKSNGVTVEDYEASYERIRVEYEKLFKQVQQSKNWSEEQTAKALFGSYKEGEFFRRLAPEEYTEYGPRAAVFQTNEIGLSPNCNAMIDKAVRENPDIEVITGFKVTGPPEREPLRPKGELGKLFLECISETGEKLRIAADQVVGCAWQHNATIIPPPEDMKIIVEQRGMMHYDFPPQLDKFLDNAPNTESMFTVKGWFGSMMSFFNDRSAWCYIPSKTTSYLKTHTLTAENPRLPANWKIWPTGEREARERHYDKVCRRRFKQLNERGATNGRMIVEDVVRFWQNIAIRPQDRDVRESGDGAASSAAGSVFMGMGLKLSDKAELSQQQQAVWKLVEAPVFESSMKGVHANYASKGTYAFSNAIRTVFNIKQRSKLKDAEAFVTPPTPHEIVDIILADPKPYTLDMQTLTPKEKAQYFKGRTDHTLKMLDGPPQELLEIKQYMPSQPFTSRIAPNTGRAR